MPRRAPPAAARVVRCGLAALALALSLAAAAQERGPVELFPSPPPVPPPPELEPPPTDREPALRVEELPAPGIDAIGEDAGLGARPWQGSDPALVAALLPRLPPTLTLPPLRDLARALLLSPGGQGADGEGRLLRMRLEGLLAQGAVAEARDLLARLPLAEDDEALARLRADTALLAGDLADACTVGEAARGRFADPFWIRLDVACRAEAGDEPAARLGLGLLRDLDAADPAFDQLAEALLTGAAAPETVPEPLPLALAMFALADQPVPESALEEAGPAALARIAASDATPIEHRLRAGEAAALAGALAVEELAELQRGLAEADADLEIDEAPAGALGRAQLLQAIAREREPAERAELVAALLARDSAGPMALLLAELVAPVMVDLPPSPELAFAAPPLARALLATARSPAARAWLAVLAEAAAGDPALAAAEARLAPLLALADPAAAVGEETLLAWRRAQPDLPPERLYALMQGQGLPVPATLWRERLVDGDLPEAGAPTAALWHALADAAAEGRVGETVLLALLLLEGRPHEAHPLALSHALASLREVGLGHEARRIAVATALAAGY